MTAMDVWNTSSTNRPTLGVSLAWKLFMPTPRMVNTGMELPQTYLMSRFGDWLPTWVMSVHPRSSRSSWVKAFIEMCTSWMLWARFWAVTRISSMAPSALAVSSAPAVPDNASSSAANAAPIVCT